MKLVTGILVFFIWIVPMWAGGAGPSPLEDERIALDAVHHALYREWKALGEAGQRLTAEKRALHEELREIHGDTEADRKRREEILEALADYRQRKSENRDAIRDHKEKKRMLDRLKKSYLMKIGSD